MDVLIAVIPTIGVMALFAYVLHVIVRADSKERAALRRLEKEYEDRQ